MEYYYEWAKQMKLLDLIKILKNIQNEFNQFLWSCQEQIDHYSNEPAQTDTDVMVFNSLCLEN